MPRLDSSLFEVVWVHQTEYSSNSSLSEPSNVLVLRRVCAQAYSRISNFREEQLAEEVAVSFLDMTIDYPDTVPNSPRTRALRSKLTSIRVGLLNLEYSTGFTLINELSIVAL